jgi:hypothetical protein
LSPHSALIEYCHGIVAGVGNVTVVCTADGDGCRLLNIDDQDCSCIKIFKSNGAADGTVNLNGTSDAVSFAFNRENTALWVADAASGTVSKYAYSDGGPLPLTG